MLELVLMAVLCGKLREILSAKHRSAIGYQIAMVGLWVFVHPVWLGLLCAGLIFVAGGEGEQLVLFAYVFSLFSVVACSLVVLLAAVSVRPRLSQATGSPES